MMNKFLVLDQQLWKTEGNLFTNKAGALPSPNLNFVPISSDQTEGYISPVIVLGKVIIEKSRGGKFSWNRN